MTLSAADEVFHLAILLQKPETEKQTVKKKKSKKHECKVTPVFSLGMCVPLRQLLV